MRVIDNVIKRLTSTCSQQREAASPVEEIQKMLESINDGNNFAGEMWKLKKSCTIEGIQLPPAAKIARAEELLNSLN